ncbi:CrcB family protein [Brachybacterium sp.]|uniref:fluoride efflux transporter FluC n=1 Tax=Brachybacterium sp. TaxID=1891286 RepID=UPI002ED1A256
MTSSPSSSPHPPRRDDPRMQTVEMAALRYEDITESETLGSGPVPEELDPLRTALLVGVGGALGAILRFSLTVIAPTVTTPTLVELPWATLWVNLLGCLALGALNGTLEVTSGRPWIRPLLGTGLCGGFTTFSAVVLEGSAIIGADFPILALTYAVLTMGLCLGGVVLGLFGGRRLARGLRDRRAAHGEDAA